MNVHVQGARIIGGQADRIEEGFRALGHNVTPHVSEADLVFVNDGGEGRYEQVIKDRADGAITGKVILNVLDLCPHCEPPVNVTLIREQLAHADAVTCISATVQRDLAARAGVSATIVYNPIRAVARDRVDDATRPFRAMFVGRVNDPEKRSGIGASALAILGLGYEEVITVGREAPFYGGVYWGTATDEVLASLYNQTPFLICPTRNAFLGLPILEAMACGTIPVVCNDLDIRDEFLPRDVFPEYDEVTADPPSIARFVGRYLNSDTQRAAMSERVYQHYQQHWAEKLSPRGVAQAILDVHQRLTPNWP